MALKFIIVSLFPDIIKSTLEMGVVGQGLEKGLLSVQVISPREYVFDVHKTVDDRPFGGGDGMIMLANPLRELMDSLGERKNLKSIYMSPQGKVFNHAMALEIAQIQNKTIVLICGRYGGIDQRFINEYVDQEISIGDFILSGGELAALSIVDAVARQVEGVLGHKESSKNDSFAFEGLLESPSFTRPREWKSQLVPDILLSGNHSKIEEYRLATSLLITFCKRKDLFESYLKNNKLTQKQWSKIKTIINELTEENLRVLGINSSMRRSFLEEEV